MSISTRFVFCYIYLIFFIIKNKRVLIINCKCDWWWRLLSRWRITLSLVGAYKSKNISRNHVIILFLSGICYTQTVEIHIESSQQRGQTGHLDAYNFKFKTIPRNNCISANNINAIYGGIELDSSLNLVIGLFRVSCWLEWIEMY